MATFLQWIFKLHFLSLISVTLLLIYFLEVILPVMHVIVSYAE